MDNIPGKKEKKEKIVTNTCVTHIQVIWSVSGIILINGNVKHIGSTKSTLGLLMDPTIVACIKSNCHIYKRVT